MTAPAPAPDRTFELALCNEVVRELPFAEQCDLAAALGYDALEVAPFTLVDDPREFTPAGCANVRKAAEDAGIRVSGLHWLLNVPDALSITSPDRAVRTRTLDVMRALITACAELGGSVLVHGSPGQRTISDDDPEVDALRATEAFALAGAWAGEVGVTYVVEPLSTQETRFVNRLDQAEALIAEIAEPALRSMIDTRAARLSEIEPTEEVLARGLAAGTVAHVHLNDRDRRAPGQGDDRFAGVIATLLHARYRGTVSVEPFRYEPSGVAVAARAIGYVQGLVEASAP